VAAFGTGASSRTLQGRGSSGFRFTLYAVLSVVAMYLDQRGHYLEQVRYALQAAAYPIQLAVSSPPAAWHWLRDSFQSRATLQAENERLRAQQRDLELRSMRYEALARENGELRGLREALPPVADRWLAAEIVTVQINGLRQRLLLNRGASNGVFKGQAVLDDRGLIGQTVHVGPWSAEVILITDPEHAVPVRIERTGLRTIAEQLRYSTDENTNLRFAFTRGIARPQYSDLAPFFSASGVLINSPTSPLSEGNPTLKPQYAWNYDLLGEHFFSSVGILSGGLFYKQISQFIFGRTFEYTGPLAIYKPRPDTVYYVSQPQNGPSAWEYGFELDYTQHLSFLPGAWRGVGFDVNWTWVQSKAKIPVPSTDSSRSYPNPNTGQTVYPYVGTPYRYAPIQRQFPNLYNISLLYDYVPISMRLSGQYTSASIYGYGLDGTSNVNSGDNYNYAHFQLDYGFSWALMPNSSLSIQALNLTNSVFGFFNGTTRNAYNTQREYYGTTVSIGFRQGF
jgi:rod shape-determining protein MreC